MVSIFGFNIVRKRAEEIAELPSPIPEVKDDGATVIQAVVGGAYGQFVDLDGSVKNEAELVTRYRQMTQNGELAQALVHIVNEAIVNEDDQDVVALNFDEAEEDEIPKELKEILIEQFDEVLRLLEFKTHAYEIFRTWYVDGRLYYHLIIDPADIKAGIQELRYIQPTKIRKIREVRKLPDPKNQVVMTKTVNEFYIYNETGFGNTQKGLAVETKGIKIAKDSIVLTTSGITDEYGKMVISYLHEAIKPLNQLRSLEDAAVIYRLVRAPERRVFYIDVGDLPKAKAEQYLRDMMVKYKNKLVYDATSGDVRDDRRFMTMMEDFWLPRRGDGRATQIETLPGGENLGQMDDVLYFQKKLFASLHVPISRLDPDAMQNFGGMATEISHEEINFSRFVDRIRMRFSQLFIELLERQVILTGCMTPDEWAVIKPKLKFKFARDTFFSELKNQQILTARMQVLTLMMPYIGRFYSNKWVRTNILNQTEDDQDKMDDEIQEEASNPQYAQIDPATGMPQENPLDPNAVPNMDSPMGVDDAMALTPAPSPADEKLDKNGKPKPKPKPAGAKKK